MTGDFQLIIVLAATFYYCVVIDRAIKVPWIGALFLSAFIWSFTYRHSVYYDASICFNTLNLWSAKKHYSPLW